MRIFALAFALIFSRASVAGELHGIIRNNDGVSRYAKGRPMEAYGKFTDALGDSPFAPEIQFNIGDTFLQIKELDKAISQYRLAISLAQTNSSRDREIRFRSYFNIGSVLASQNKAIDALENYQQALETKPDSIETKTNMELLSQQGGQGDKDDKDKKDGKDGESKPDQSKQDQSKQDQGKPNPDKNPSNKPQDPQPFKGKDLSKQDVDRILDELKQQEESIRAKDQQDGGKDVQPDKDW